MENSFEVPETGLGVRGSGVGVRDSGRGIRILGLGIPESLHKSWDAESGIWNWQFEIRDSGFRMGSKGFWVEDSEVGLKDTKSWGSAPELRNRN